MLFFDRQGVAVGSWIGPDAGVQKPVELDFSTDGALQMFDASNETWVRLK